MGINVFTGIGRVSSSPKLKDVYIFKAKNTTSVFNVGKRIVINTLSTYKHESLIAIPKGKKVSYKVVIHAEEQSYAWSSGSSELFVGTGIGTDYAINKSFPIVQGDSNCSEANDNIFDADGFISGTITDTKAINFKADWDMVTVITNCGRIQEIEIMMVFPDTDESEVEIINPNWLNDLNSYSLIKT